MVKEKENDCSKSSNEPLKEFNKNVTCPECGASKAKTHPDNPDYYICVNGHVFKKNLRQIWHDNEEFRQNKKMKKSFNTEIQKNEFHDLLAGEGITACDECGKKLGLLRLIYHALFKKQGQAYYVVCRSCHTVNKRIKGNYKKEIDELLAK